jgi:regulator of cell morphogenesis and NO signaling
MTAIDPTVSVGQLVAERPGRARVFERFGIDYCCGGKMPLRDACATGALDSQMVVAALIQADAEAAATDGTDWTQARLADLVANILETHHD